MYLHIFYQVLHNFYLTSVPYVALIPYYAVQNITSTFFFAEGARQTFHYESHPDNLPSPLAAGSPEPSFALQSVCDSGVNSECN